MIRHLCSSGGSQLSIKTKEQNGRKPAETDRERKEAEEEKHKEEWIEAARMK